VDCLGGVNEKGVGIGPLLPLHPLEPFIPSRVYINEWDLGIAGIPVCGDGHGKEWAIYYREGGGDIREGNGGGM